MGLSPAGNKAPRSRLLTPPPQRDGEEKIQKARGLRQGQAGITHHLWSQAKQTQFWGKINQFNLLPTKSE